jgi:hypothetical protein
MVINPGEQTFLTMEFMMHGEMGGKHLFRVHLLTNDPVQSDKTLSVLSNWVPDARRGVPTYSHLVNR